MPVLTDQHTTMVYKGIVLKDTESGRYYTDDYHGLWSRDIQDARRFQSEEDAESHVTERPDDFESGMVAEVVKVWIITKKP